MGDMTKQTDMPIIDDKGYIDPLDLDLTSETTTQEALVHTLDDDTKDLIRSLTAAVKALVNEMKPQDAIYPSNDDIRTDKLIEVIEDLTKAVEDLRITMEVPK